MSYHSELNESVNNKNNHNDKQTGLELHCNNQIKENEVIDVNTNNILKVPSNRFKNVSFSGENHLQHQIYQHQLSLHRENSVRFSADKKRTENDLESKMNRMYSFLLVKYHFAFILLGVFICLVLTGVGFVKQPLPSFLDPKKGFGARGEGTLTSKLYVMKNINKELIKYQHYILNVYEQVKIANRSDFDVIDDKSPYEYGYDYENDYENETYDYYDEYQSKYDYWNEKDENERSNLEYENSMKLRNKRDLDFTKRIDWTKDEDLRFLNDKIIFKGLTGKAIIDMMPLNITITEESKKKAYVSQKKYNYDSIKSCDVSLDLNSNLEFYFTASDSLEAKKKENYNRNQTKKIEALQYFEDIDTEYSIHTDKNFPFLQKNDEIIETTYLLKKERNLLNIKNLKSLCHWDKKLTHKLAQTSVRLERAIQQSCYYSLPAAIALMNNKNDCMQITSDDVRNFLSLCKKCYPLQKAGILFLAAEDSKKKSDMDSLLTKNDPISKFMRLPFIKENVCFKNNLMHIVFEYLVDKEFMRENDNNSGSMIKNKSFNIKTSTLLILNDEISVKNATIPDTKNDFIYNSDFVFDFYMNDLNQKHHDDHVTKLNAINLIGIREEAAMRLISQEMSLVALAILFIVTATLLYLKSIVISMMINISVGMAIGIAFFIYRIIFDIELFPFLNMMAAFLLLGIACDDVFVLFDSWYNEKAKVIMEDLPEMIEKQYTMMGFSEDQVLKDINGSQIVDTKPVEAVEEYLLPPMFIERKFIDSYNEEKKKKILTKENPVESKRTENETLIQSNKTLSLRKNSGINIELENAGISIERLNDYMLNPGYIKMAILNDEQLIRVMGGTLRHAASSIFVTSFTTAAAFLSNYITKLPYVQLFGMFTGTCILVYFIMVITMLVAFVVTYEKYIKLWHCKLKPKFTDSWERIFNRLMEKIALMNYCAICRNLPKILIKLRFLFFTIFLILGISGMIAVFYKPKLKPPANWKYQFFRDGNLFENFEFVVKDEILAYINEEKRNLTNPEIFFVFGIKGRDTGSIFDPDDEGFLDYDKNFDFLDPISQQWLNDFINISIANRTDLFLGQELVKEWNDYLRSIQQMCYKTLGLDPTQIFKKIFLPYERESLSKCRDEINSFLQNSSIRNFESLMSSFPRRIIFIARGRDVTGILLRVNANRTFSDYHAVKDYYDGVNDFSSKSFESAPKGFDSGWFISISFALYDLQYQLISGTYSSLVASMAIALFILLLTSGNVIISILAIITISFSIADTIAIFVFLGWNLDILESVVIIMSVGLSVDFSCHYGVAYINADVHCITDTTLNSIFESAVTNQINTGLNQKENDIQNLKLVKESENLNITKTSSTSLKSTCKLTTFFKRISDHNKRCDRERFIRVEDIFNRVGSAVLMAAITTFLAGSSMFPSGLISFGKMGQFLMLVMCTSYLFATFFFVPMCAIFGPTKNFGKLNLKKVFKKIFSKCKCYLSKKTDADSDKKIKIPINSMTTEMNLKNQTPLSS